MENLRLGAFYRKDTDQIQKDIEYALWVHKDGILQNRFNTDYKENYEEMLEIGLQQALKLIVWKTI